MEILVRDHSDSNELLYGMKDYRNDVFVRIGDQIYNLFIMERSRLIREVEEAIEEEGYYTVEQNTVVTDSVNIDDVIARCVRIGEGAFRCMHPSEQSNGRIALNLSDAEKKMYRIAGWQLDFEENELSQVYCD